jgi:hypothetical protein
MDTSALRAAYEGLDKVAQTVDADDLPPAGEWNADQILAHIVLINAATISAACWVTSGAVATYDNRLAQDAWTIDRTIALAGRREGLRRRIQLQADALIAVVSTLSETELSTPIPAILVSNDSLLLDDRVPLEGLIDGLATSELPGHATQLSAIRRPEHLSGSRPAGA